jgi:hypothetical protein
MRPSNGRAACASVCRPENVGRYLYLSADLPLSTHEGVSGAHIRRDVFSPVCYHTRAGRE